MLRSFLGRLFGARTESPLDRNAKDQVFKVRGQPWTPAPGAIELAAMDGGQRLVADIFIIRVRGYCELHEYDFANFRGPYLWPANDPDWRDLAAKLLGPCSDPGYQVWRLEFVCPHGDIAGIGDSRGEFKVHADGMYLPGK